MNQETFDIILAAVRMAKLVNRDGIDPIESRIAIIAVCEAVKQATNQGKLPKENKP